MSKPWTQGKHCHSLVAIPVSINSGYLICSNMPLVRVSILPLWLFAVLPCFVAISLWLHRTSPPAAVEITLSLHGHSLNPLSNPFCMQAWLFLEQPSSDSYQALSFLPAKFRKCYRVGVMSDGTQKVRIISLDFGICSFFYTIQCWC